MIMNLRKLLLGLALLAGSVSGAMAGDGSEPSLLIYISPHEYNHEVRIGAHPYYTAWVLRGPLVEKAARTALQPLFREVDSCDGSNSADVIVWLKPQLSYNPALGRYYVQIKAQFHLGNANHLATLKATGQYDGFLGSVYVDSQVQQAYADAMQDIVRQYAADANLHEAIRSGLAKGITRSPCGMVPLIHNP